MHINLNSTHFHSNKPTTDPRGGTAWPALARGSVCASPVDYSDYFTFADIAFDQAE